MTPCTYCLFAKECCLDIVLSKHCRLSDAQVIAVRPELVKNADRTQYFADYHKRSYEPRNDLGKLDTMLAEYIRTGDHADEIFEIHRRNVLAMGRVENG